MNIDLDLIEKTVALLFSLLILINGYLLAKVAKTWLIPSCLMSIFWFGYSFLPLIGLYTVPVNAISIVYIFVAVFLFSLPAYFINWNAARAKNQLKVKMNMKYEFHTGFLMKTFYFIQCLVVMIIILDILAQGFAIRDIIFNLVEVSSQYIALRYAGEINATLLSRMGTVFNYVGVMLGGLVFSTAIRTSKKYFILLLTLLPSVVIMVVQGAKGTLFLCAVLFYSTFLIYRIYEGNLKISDKKVNRNIVLALMVLFPAVISSFLSRGLYGYDADYIIERLISYFSSYAFAHLYAFSDWFSFYTGNPHTNNYTSSPEYYFGFYTFMSLFRLMGDTTEVPPGIYDEYFQYNDFLQTNIYTFFRGLILDFGIGGSFIFMLILGAIANISFRNVLRSVRPYFSLSFFSVMTGFYYTSFIISIFIWNSIFFTFLIFSAILYLNRKVYLLKITKHADTYNE
ncbi:MAG TPA: O-antigen polymerase [Cellvibrio sp.]|nr:O-antigen polymerase [Cellvibrio sp.]